MCKRYLLRSSAANQKAEKIPSIRREGQGTTGANAAIIIVIGCSFSEFQSFIIIIICVHLTFTPTLHPDL